MARHRKETTTELVSKHLAWRTQLLRALGNFSLANISSVKTDLACILAELRTIKPKLLGEEAAALEVIEALVDGFSKICEWYGATLGTDASAGRFRDAGRALGELALAKTPSLPFNNFRTKATGVATQLAQLAETRQITELARLLVRIPVPPFFVEAKDPLEEITGGMRVPTGEDVRDKVNESEDSPVAVGVMFSVEGRPWVNPHVLQANVSYDIGLTLKVPKWPVKADRLVLDFVSTLPESHYRMSEFVVPRPTSGDQREFTLKGQVVFPVAGSVLSEPSLLQTRAAFLSVTDSSFAKTTTIIGYHKLQVRVADPSRVPFLTKFRMLDNRLVEIVEQIRQLNGVPDQQLTDFVEAFSAVLNYAGVCAQTAVYRASSNVGEDDFQRNLLIHLRGQLGEDVVEAPRQAGGITDIKYKSIVIELKVEKTQSDRKKIFEAYEKQPVQYASGSGAQLSILCVLDLCRKISPPAPPQSSVKLLEPAVHGFETGKCPHPVRVGAVVIDGNLELPSSYSR
jgi:hypothetical protein